MKADVYNRIFTVLVVMLLAGWLGWLGYDAEDIAAICGIPGGQSIAYIIAKSIENKGK